MSGISRLSRLVLLICGCCLLLYCLLGLGVRGWLQQHPDTLIRPLVQSMEAATGLSCSVGAADVSLFPLPAVTVTDVRMEGPRAQLEVSYASVQLHLRDLLRGVVAPGTITLLRPRCRLNTESVGLLQSIFAAEAVPSAAAHTSAAPLPALNPAAAGLPGTRTSAPTGHAPADATAAGSRPAAADAASQAGAGDAATPAQSPAAPFDLKNIVLPALSFDCAIDVSQGEITLAAADGDAIELHGVDANVRLTAPHGITGRLSVATSSYCRKGACAASLEALTVTSSGDVLRLPQGAAGDISVSCLLRRVYTGLPAVRVTLSLTQKTGETAPLLGLSVKNDPADKTPLFPIAAHVTARWAAPRLTLESGSLHMDNDALDLSGAVDWSIPDNPVFTGRAEVRRLSLIQWFGFGRSLPAGLQHALDNLSGELVFALDGQGLRVTELRASAAGATFSGSGGVPAWRTPVITLYATATAADLASILPESLGTFPEPLVFRHNALIPPATDTADDDGETALSYDIRLHSDALAYGPLHAQQVDFSVRPAGERVRLDFNVGACAGGQGRGSLLLGEAQGSTTYAIDCALMHVDTGKLGAALGFTHLKMPDGQMDATAALTASGNTGAAFLRTLNGQIALHSAAGALYLPAAGARQQARNFPHQGYALTLALRSAAYSNALLNLTGRWKAQMTTTAATLEAQGDGTCSFGPQFARTKDFPLRVQAKLPPSSALPQGAAAVVRGIFSLDTTQKTVRLHEAGLTALGASAGGDWLVQQDDNGLPVFEGTLRLEGASLRNTLRHLGISLPVTRAENMFGTFLLTASAKMDANSVTLNGMRLALDNSVITGSLAGKPSGAGVQLRGALNVDSLNADAYRAPRKQGGAGRAGETAWNMRALRESTVEMQLHCGSMRAGSCTLKNLKLPVTLKDGKLSVDARATAYGGPVHAALTADAGQEALNSRLSFTAQGFDMLAATRDRKLSSDVAGTGDVQMTASGLFRSGRDIPAKADGTWRFSLSNGYQQTRDGKGSPTGRKTRFSHLSASGSMDKGVLRSSDILLRGEDMTISGSGWADLDKETLGGNLVVKMPRLPDIPVKLSGTLDEPHTSVQAGKALAGGLEKLGFGLLDAVGGVLDSTMKLLR